MALFQGDWGTGNLTANYIYTWINIKKEKSKPIKGNTVVGSFFFSLMRNPFTTLSGLMYKHRIEIVVFNNCKSGKLNKVVFFPVNFWMEAFSPMKEIYIHSPSVSLFEEIYSY